MENLKEKYSTQIMSLSVEIEEKLNLYIDASEAYYNTEEPILSDEMFDELTEELIEFVSENNQHSFILEILNSIQTKDGLTSVDNVISQMISLKKIKWVSLSQLIEIQKFLNPNRKSEIEYFYSLKYDGMAIKVSKQDKTLILTRGGQDVTSMLINHKDIRNITRPITHGELVIKKSVFLEKYADEYENPRNCILGVLKQNPNDLDFIECTDGISPLNNNVWTSFKNISPTLPSVNLENYYFEQKEKSQYLIDGLVIGYKTDVQIVKENYPMNIVSVKFKSPTVRTKVIDFDWTQKKSGNLTPVILIEPVKLDGSTITKVAGYNYSNLKNAHIGIGSIIEITKSGDIIPIVKKVITRSDNIKMPDVEYTILGKNLVAVNQEESKRYRFILGLKLLSIDGIGPTIAESIGEVVDFDIIELFNSEHKPKIVAVLGSGAVWNNFQIFYNIKNIGLDLLIEILQFQRCGKTLSKRFADIILKISNDTSGIEKNVLTMVCRGEGFQKIQESMKKLHSFGVKVIKPITVDETTISYELTGNPPGMTKNEFKEKLSKKYPNSIHTTLTKQTKYLFVDSLSSNSGKINKARKYNVKIVTYEDALQGKL